MSPASSPLGLEDLTALDAQAVMARNADLWHLSRREYDVGGLDLRFERVETPQPAQAGDIYLALLHAGSLAHVRVSRPWADSLASAVGIRLDGLGPDKLELLCLTRLSPHLPKSVQFQAAAYALTDLPPTPNALHDHGTWCGVHSNTGEFSGHALQILADGAFPVYAFIAAFDQYLKRALPPRMAGLPLSVPLVAARWTTDAADLVGLEVGDVLLIG